MEFEGMKVFIYPPPIRRIHLERARNVRVHSRYRQLIETAFDRVRTWSPESADWFLLPINLIHWQFSNAFPDPREEIERLEFLDRGRHLVIATGDFGQRRKSVWESSAPGRAYPDIYQWLDHKWHLIAFESTPDLLPQDFALFPFALPCSGFRERCLRISGRLQRCQRDLFFSFAGAISYPQLPATHMRGGALKALCGLGKDWFVGSSAESIRVFGWMGTAEAILRRSTFALCPAGFGRWTFRLAQALEQGAIPVLLADDYELPDKSQIDWDSMVVRIPEKDVLSVQTILRTMHPDEIRARQQAIQKWASELRGSRILERLIERIVQQTPPLGNRGIA